jgi:hypothetical protein
VVETPKEEKVLRGKGKGCYSRLGKPTKCQLILKGDFLDFFFFMYDIKHCFICRPSDSTVSEDAGIEPRTVATTALAVRRAVKFVCVTEKLLFTVLFSTFFRLIITDDSDINTPAVAAAYAGK